MFLAWPKIPRYENDSVVITEKIDGTNACIAFHNDGSYHVQSRSKIITPQDDNYGFAKWVEANLEDLKKLGPGYHYGEWWGAGIQRRYNLTEKKFSLFNAGRWNQQEKPACCDVVPILYQGKLDEGILHLLKGELSSTGSKAAPGFKNPEGMVVYYTQSKTMQKVIINK